MALGSMFDGFGFGGGLGGLGGLGGGGGGGGGLGILGSLGNLLPMITGGRSGFVPAGNGRPGATSFVGQLMGMASSQAAGQQGAMSNATNQFISVESRMRNISTAPMAGVGTVEGASPEVILMMVMLMMHQLASEKMNYESNILKDNVEKQKLIHEQLKSLRDTSNELQTTSENMGNAQNALSSALGPVGGLASALMGPAKSAVDSQKRGVDNETKDLENREKELEDFSQLKMMRVKQLEQLINLTLQTWNSADDKKNQTLSAISGSISR